MAGKGGYQRPENPAMSSGPGALSQRTDGGPGRTLEQASRYISGRPYGEGKILNANQNAAPLAGSGIPTDSSLMQQGQDLPVVRPLTERGDPNVPLTQGMPFGPGDNAIPGYSPVSLEINPETGIVEQSDQVQSQYENASRMLQRMAEDPDASPTLKYLAERIGQAY